MASMLSRISLGLILGFLGGAFVAFALKHHTDESDVAGAMAGTAIFFWIFLRAPQSNAAPKTPEQERLDAFKQRRS